MNGSFVSFNGQNLPVFAAANVNGQEQINFQAPTGGQGVLIAGTGSAHGVPVEINVQIAVPGVFTLDGTRGAIQHANGQLVTPANPAAGGEVVVVYATGLGAVNPDPGLGNPAAADPLSYTSATPTASIGGRAAQVQFSGLTPSFVGLNQVNVQIPQSVSSGDQDLVLTITVPAGTAGSHFTFSSPPVKLAIQ